MSWLALLIFDNVRKDIAEPFWLFVLVIVLLGLWVGVMATWWSLVKGFPWGKPITARFVQSPAEGTNHAEIIGAYGPGITGTGFEYSLRADVVIKANYSNPTIASWSWIITKVNDPSRVFKRIAPINTEDKYPKQAPEQTFSLRNGEERRFYGALFQHREEQGKTPLPNLVSRYLEIRTANPSAFWVFPLDDPE